MTLENADEHHIDPESQPVLTSTTDASGTVDAEGAQERSEDIDEAGSESIPQQDRQTKKKRHRRKRSDSHEHRLLGRRSMCKRAAEIAPHMLKTVKMRVLARHLDSKRGMDDEKLTELLISESEKIVGRDAVLASINEPDPDVHRRNLKEIILNVILLQEETYSLDDWRLDERVLEYETQLVESAKSLELFDSEQHDPQRALNCDIYRVVLDAAWRNNDDISLDEAELLRVLRDRLDISGEDHRLISTHIERFPKPGCALHTRDEIHAARKELQREGLVWSYRDETNGSIDVIPLEVAEILRKDVIKMQLQRKNKQRLLQHDCLLLSDLRQVLSTHNMDRYGSKATLIARLVDSDVQPRYSRKSCSREMGKGGVSC